ncbi:nucleotide-binding protein [Leucobacter sp. gxy201]|uniref:TIR domain-containing protein n=1 Tax=Leucobacter sp. gxy201 TaxID=2957200 RepID=UPI003DA05EC8
MPIVDTKVNNYLPNAGTVREIRDYLTAQYPDFVVVLLRCEVRRGDTTWSWDNTDELIHDLEQNDTFGIASFVLQVKKTEDSMSAAILDVNVHGTASGYTLLSITATDRFIASETLRICIESIERAFKIPEETKEVKRVEPKIFVGHGRSPLWRELKDHLQDSHGFHVRAFETGSRAGHTIRDILDSELDKSNFAFIVMTGEDTQGDGGTRARQNVVHEAGLFQGRLGFDRAIILMEEGTENFSNVDGLQYIPFSKGNIREAYGDAAAAVKAAFNL